MSGIPEATFAREAAVIALGKMLEGKGRGDRVTASEIQAATGFDDWRSFRGRIFTWAKHRGLVPFAVKNDGWRFGTPSEHVDFAENKRRSALRAERRGLKALGDTPRAELDDVQERRVMFAIGRSARRVADAERDDRETRAEFKLGGDRVPLRALASGKT